MKPAPTNVPHQRNALVEMLTIALPSIVTMTSYTVMQFIDSLMVSRIGPEPVYVAAQGNAGIFAWTAMSLGLGAFTIINSFVSQHLGAGSPQKGAAYVWNGLYIALAYSIALVPIAFFLVPVVFSKFYNHSGQMLEIETEYAQIVLLGAIFTLGSRALAQYFFGLHRPMVVTIAAIIANLVNVAANALLIFGTDGPPPGTPFAEGFRTLATTLNIQPMGVAGAAWGTVIGTSIELVIPLVVFLSPHYRKVYKTLEGWRPSAARVGDICRVGWPGGLMFASELICWGYLMSVLLKLGGTAAALDAGLPMDEALEEGVIHNSAGFIALRYMHASFMPTVGLSIAVAAIVGKCIGMGRPDLAVRRAKLGLGIGVGYMGLCAIGFVVFRHELVSVFVDETMPPEQAAKLLQVGAAVLIAAAVFQVFDAIAIILSAALRGAGDTVWPGAITVVLSWVCIIAGGHLLIHFVPSWGSIGPWIGASLYIVLLGSALMWRAHSGAWKRIKLIERTDAEIDGPVPEQERTSTEG